MTTDRFEEIARNFEFLDEWEDRYRYVIELGKDMPALEEAFRVPATALFVLVFGLSAGWVFALALAEEIIKFLPFHRRLWKGEWKKATPMG